MRMHHRLYNPAPTRRGNVRKRESYAVGIETVHVDEKTGEPDFLYFIESPSVKGDSWDYKIRSLGGMELRSGSADSEKGVKKDLKTDLISLVKDLNIERAEAGVAGTFEAQGYTDIEPLFPGQIARSPSKEYEGYEIIVRREYPDTDEPAGYYYSVETVDGAYRAAEAGPIPSRGEAEARAHLLAGISAGMREFVESNPATRKRFASWISRNRRTNPKVTDEFGKRELSFAEMAGMPAPIAGIPGHPEEAALFGYYIGVLRGINTCGVKKIYERYKIRKTIEKLLAEAQHEAAEAAIAPRAGAQVRVVGGPRRGRP